jgi:hypothetical protein
MSRLKRMSDYYSQGLAHLLNSAAQNPSVSLGSLPSRILTKAHLVSGCRVRETAQLTEANLFSLGFNTIRARTE